MVLCVTIFLDYLECSAVCLRDLSFLLKRYMYQHGKCFLQNVRTMCYHSFYAFYGVRQSGVLSPLLFAAYVNNILHLSLTRYITLQHTSGCKAV